MTSDRRNFLKLSGLTGIGFAGFSLIPTYASQSEISSSSVSDPEDVSSLEPLNRFPRSVHEYFVRRVREVEQSAEKRRSLLRSRQDAETYVKEVRNKIQQCLGPWPERNPLNVRITGILDCDTYKIEKVIFDSRPGFPVTANLYVPKGRKFPLPGIIGSCGHSDPGKSTPYNQSFAQGLAKMGYVVLIFDPIG